MTGPTSQRLSRLVVEPGPGMTRAAVRFLRPLMRVISRHAWAGIENVPRTGGAVLTANHISNFDPLVISHFVVHAGRWPYFLAKASLFSVPVLGAILRGARQIPVHRESASAQAALAAGCSAIEEGKMIIVYPEGTITSDPDGWPRTAKSGAARLALTTGCPVVPVGQWGAQAVLGMKKIAAPRLIPRPMIKVTAGPPVDLDDLRGQPITRAVLDQATDRIMTAITELVADLRDEPIPTGPTAAVDPARDDPTPEDA